jgi:hypothetical protein
LRAGLRASIRAAALAAVVLVAPGGARATETGSFDVLLGGVRAAVVSYAANTDGDRYAVTGKLSTTGVVGAMVRVSYEATARGRQTGPGRYRPTSFTEIRDSAREVSRAEMRFAGGRPQVKTYVPPRETDRHAVDPATQAGTVDPMTVIYAALRDQPRDQVCDLALQVFDGKRRSEVTLSNPSPETGAGEITCKGQYRRIAGWSPDKLAERTRFDFEMTYARQPDGVYRVTRVTTDTTLGRAVLRRR